MITIYKNYWMEINKDEHRYFMRYNSGDLVNSIIEIEVTEEEAIQAQESVEAADRIINYHWNIEQFGEDYMNQWQQNHGGQ